MPPTLYTRLFASSRGRIVQRLRSGGLTVDDLATQLGLSQNAVRVQMTGLERDGLVHHASSERRTTRPSHVFQLTREAQQLLSNAYIPFLIHLVSTMAQRQPPKAIAKLMRDTGKSLAATLRARAVSTGPLAARAAAASAILNEELGAATRVEARDKHVVIRGHGCPLAALIDGQPTVCLALETLLAELTNTRVRECCNREQPPQCCFELTSARRPSRRA
jgi:predicted ArsR family transcriptional regulator